MFGNSPYVRSNQDGIHEKLETVVRKHLSHDYLRPIPAHTQQAFDVADKTVRERGQCIILDSGCGAGDSTIFLAKRFPKHLIIGVDKSLVRLNKASRKQAPGNMMLLRADQFDFWRLLERAGWPIDAHYIFYPNPWPKKQHLGRRIHGHPAFGALVKLAEYIEVRSNWSLYVEEFALALKIAGRTAVVRDFKPATPVSLFEKKFYASGQSLYRVFSHTSETFLWT